MARDDQKVITTRIKNTMNVVRTTFTVFVNVLKNGEGNVVLSHSRAEGTPDMECTTSSAINVTPDQARELAKALTEMADAAELVNRTVQPTISA